MKAELESIEDGIVNLKIDDIETLVNKALDAGCASKEILDAVRRGSEEVGKKFEKCEYFLSDLIMAGETMKAAVKALKPHMKGVAEESGRIVIGTIEGDLHDIGKDIVATLLSASGFEVFDLGIDVPPKRFADEANSRGVDVVGVSALLSVTVPTIKKVSEELEKISIRGKVKVIAGGAALRKEYIDELKIDAAVNDAVEGVEIIKSWVKTAEFKR